jgi:hypothetical protein
MKKSLKHLPCPRNYKPVKRESKKAEERNVEKTGAKFL